jgi:LacI family transcriptional regulator
MASMIGVVTADVGDPFWSGVLRGVEAEIAGGDRFILSASVRDRSDHEAEIVSAMVERRVMALLLVPTTDDQSHLAAVTAAGTPVVCLDRPARGADVDAVVADDVGGAERGVRLLLDHGHRRIAFLATPSIYTTGQRLIGYRNALSAAGLPVDERLLDAAIPASDQVEPVVRRMLALDEPPTAVFSANVAVSVGVLSQLRVLRWSPAIVAFSDFDAARIADPMITVVHNDPVELGRRAAELALGRLDGYTGPPRMVRLETPLLLRESHRLVHQ